MAPRSRRVQNLEFVENNFENEDTNDMPRNVNSRNNYEGPNITEEDLRKDFYEFHADGRMKRRRGPTKLVDIEGLPEHIKIVVTLDRFNVPVSKSSTVLGSYLGKIVRKPQLAPLNILKWSDRVFKRVYHQKMIDEVERKFAIDSRARKWLLTQLGNKWRQYKRKFKIANYKPDMPMERVLQNVPETVDQSQWATLVSYWYSDEAKAMSRTNQENAKNIKHPHTLGRKSVARKRKELEDSRGTEIDRATLFDACHKNKEGAYISPATEEKMNEVYMLLAEKKLDGDITEDDVEEAMNTVFGKDHSGRVRGMGPAITPTNYYGVRSGNMSTSNAAGTNPGNWKEAKSFMKFVVSFLQKKFPEEDVMSQAPQFLREVAQNFATHSAHDGSSSNGEESGGESGEASRGNSDEE